MFKQFIDDLIDSKSIKLILSYEAQNKFSQEEGVVLVHSPLLYRMYALYAGSSHKETRPAFYRKVGAYLYYEYFQCVHGTEYYYFIKFNEQSEFYKEHKTLIEQLILANDPSNLKAYIGNKPLNIYNKHLKEERA